MLTKIAPILSILLIPFRNVVKPYDYAAIDVKQLNLAGKNQHVDKQSPSDEIRVWQLPLSTYLLLEIKWK